MKITRRNRINVVSSSHLRIVGSRIVIEDVSILLSHAVEHDVVSGVCRQWSEELEIDEGNDAIASSKNTDQNIVRNSCSVNREVDGFEESGDPGFVVAQDVFATIEGQAPIARIASDCFGRKNEGCPKGAKSNGQVDCPNAFCATRKSDLFPRSLWQHHAQAGNAAVPRVSLAKVSDPTRIFFFAGPPELALYLIQSQSFRHRFCLFQTDTSPRLSHTQTR